MAAEPREFVADKKQYPTSADAYQIYEQIGAGAFARVYRAGIKGSEEEVAIKLLDLETFNTNWDEIRKEVAVMRALHHPNVVDVHCAFVDDQVLWIVMPLMQVGSCAAIMKQMAPKGFKDEAILATILREVLKGLVYFHEDSKIHRDIKAGNILINAQGEVKLGDFGVAGTLIDSGQRKEKRSTFTGTPCWMAPEVMEQMSGYDAKADIWSFGITAMELAFGKAPYADYQPMKVLLMTLKEDPPTIDIYKDESVAKFSSGFRSLIEKCMKRKPAKRPTAAKLLTHRFFQKARDSKYLVENIVKKMPPMKTGGIPLQMSIQDLAQHPSKQKEKPVPVGPWSYGDLKAELAKAGGLPQSSGGGGDSDDEAGYLVAGQEGDLASPGPAGRQAGFAAGFSGAPLAAPGDPSMAPLASPSSSAAPADLASPQPQAGNESSASDGQAAMAASGSPDGAAAGAGAPAGAPAGADAGASQASPSSGAADPAQPQAQDQAQAPAQSEAAPAPSVPSA